VVQTRVNRAQPKRIAQPKWVMVERGPYACGTTARASAKSRKADAKLFLIGWHAVMPVAHGMTWKVEVAENHAQATIAMGVPSVRSAMLPVAHGRKIYMIMTLKQDIARNHAHLTIAMHVTVQRAAQYRKTVSQRNVRMALYPMVDGIEFGLLLLSIVVQTAGRRRKSD